MTQNSHLQQSMIKNVKIKPAVPLKSKQEIQNQNDQVNQQEVLGLSLENQSSENQNSENQSSENQNSKNQNSENSKDDIEIIEKKQDESKQYHEKLDVDESQEFKQIQNFQTNLNEIHDKDFYLNGFVRKTNSRVMTSQHGNLMLQQKYTYKNYLKETKLPELVCLNLTYNSQSILKQKAPISQEILAESQIKKYYQQIQQNLKLKSMRNTDKVNIKISKSQRMDKKEVEIEKPFEGFITKLQINQNNKVELIQVNTNDEIFQIQQYPLSYDFDKIPPSHLIAQEKTSGRYFIYDNNNKILCFASFPVKNSDRDDRTRPLIEMFLEDENPRINPSLYIEEFEDFSCLLVIGGYRKSKIKNSTQIYPTNSIKVFRLEKRIVSTSYVLQINMANQRMNPIIFKHKDLISNLNMQHEVLQNDKNQDQFVDLLCFIGGNYISDNKKNINLTKSNETCEILSCQVLQKLVQSKRNQQKFTYDLQNSLNIRFNNELQIPSHILKSFLKGSVVYQQQENNEPRRFLFGYQRKQIIEIKSINLNSKMLDLYEGEFHLRSHYTILPCMAEINNFHFELSKKVTIQTNTSQFTSNSLNKDRFSNKFEKGKDFQQYFPHNNLNEIIDKYNKKQTKNKQHHNYHHHNNNPNNHIKSSNINQQQSLKEQKQSSREIQQQYYQQQTKYRQQQSYKQMSQMDEKSNFPELRTNIKHEAKNINYDQIMHKQLSNSLKVNYKNSPQLDTIRQSDQSDQQTSQQLSIVRSQTDTFQNQLYSSIPIDEQHTSNLQFNFEDSLHSDSINYQILVKNNPLKDRRRSSLQEKKIRPSLNNIYGQIQGSILSQNNSLLAQQLNDRDDISEEEEEEDEQIEYQKQYKDIDYVKFQKIQPGQILKNYLLKSNIPELVDLKFLYNPKTILNQKNYKEEIQNQNHKLLALEKIRQNLNQRAKNERIIQNNESKTIYREKLRTSKNTNIFQQQKKYSKFVSRLIIKHNKAELLTVNIQEEIPEIKIYPISYDFGNILPSPFITQEYKTGRYFIYDNNNKILCFSSQPTKNSDRDDRSRPLIEMFLEDENPRIDPTLYIKEFENFSCLMVIGGYRRSQQTGKIYPTDSIKLFRLESRIVSTNYVLKLKLSQVRMNPIIVKTNEKKHEQGLEDSENFSDNERYILFIGGNNLTEYKKKVQGGLLVQANETAEILKVSELKHYMERANVKKNRETVNISQTVRLRYNTKLENIKVIRECLYKGCVVLDKRENTEPRRFLFGDRRKQILEIKSINIKEKLIDIVDGEFPLNANSTVYHQMAKINGDVLFYITDTEKKVRNINLKRMQEQNEYIQKNDKLQGNAANNMAKTLLIAKTLKEPQTVQERKAGICEIF
ncbi:hypothetical protein PPERSA_10068 [Pseudocohnilembus persalinus]|uniref:Uncharacterized protein n=1 Tax=Pseudocohnilembus persalinus TaxID=266149 RepID=A0A0V0QJE5_PSEPJ|nr:hypothetical protein PPERSA_10068 [Pseudocohnilembus persalinus]|eukprot:KRX02451.1 hypothetical protein PPERSA_10068 [Pseudocohnilembus persalinus]